MRGGVVIYLSKPSTHEEVALLGKISEAKFLAKCFLYRLWVHGEMGLGCYLTSNTTSLKLSTSNLAILGLEVGLSLIVNTLRVFEAHDFTSFLNSAPILGLASLHGKLLLDEGPPTGMLVPFAKTGVSWLMEFHA